MIKKERNQKIDILKAISILLVVIGHCFSPSIKYLYLFHMPLFFIISGYLYNDYYTDNPKTMLKKRFRSLYIPFIKYEFIFLILHNIFMKINVYSNNPNVNTIINAYSIKDFIINIIKIFAFDGTESLLSPFWFLTVMFITSIMFCYISYFNKKYFKSSEKNRFLIIGILFCTGIIFTKLNIVLTYSVYAKQEINVALVAIMFFYIGYIYKKNENMIQIKGSFAVLSFVFLLANTFYNFNIDMRTNLYPSPSYIILTAICGFYLMLYISNITLKMNRCINLLNYIGKNTITILALHILSFKVIEFLQIKIYKLPIYNLANFGSIMSKSAWAILYVIVGIFIPIMIKYTYDKIAKKCVDILN